MSVTGPGLIESRDDGRGLAVTRRTHADRYTQPFVVRSFYDGTPDVADIDREFEAEYR